jgi:hypothetical protein
MRDTPLIVHFDFHIFIGPLPLYNATVRDRLDALPTGIEISDALIFL